MMMLGYMIWFDQTMMVACELGADFELHRQVPV